MPPTSASAVAVHRFPPYVAGEFETHITFRTDGGVDALAAWGRSRGAGLTHIVLARGRTPSQPMLTWRGTTTLAALREETGAFTADARDRGFEPVRVKIEAAPWHPAVPATDDEARTLGPAYYFEHHVKLLLDPAADLGALGRLASAHAAHVSHNARRSRTDGRCERFVTQRCRGVGDPRARAEFDHLLTTLELTGHHILSSEREFVVHDDNASLDDGWLDAHEGDRA